jgi:hypothetical protein
MYCKPQSSWPGHKASGASNVLFSASPSSLSQQGLMTLRASYIIRQQAPVVSANKGTRHRGQALSKVAVMQKGVDRMVHDNQKASQQRSWPKGMRPRRATNLFKASQMAVASQGRQLCGQANLLDSEPQQSRPLRARGIMGKLHCFTASLGGLSHRGHKLRCWWVAVVQKASMGQRTTMPKIASTGGFFCWEWTARACVNLDTKVDVIGCSCMQKSNAQEGEVCLVNGAPLKSRAESG